MKKFIVVGSKGAITYKDVFPLLKDRKMFVHIVSMDFINGGSVPSAWYNNVAPVRKESILLTKTYNEADYPKYDNYDAIEVSKVKDIPYDYEGVMGVPVTFLDKWDGEGFEVVGVNAGNTKGCGFINGDDGGRFYIDDNRYFARILIKKKVKFEVVDILSDSNNIGIPTYVDEQHKGYKGPVINGEALYPRILIRRKPSITVVENPEK